MAFFIGFLQLQITFLRKSVNSCIYSFEKVYFCLSLMVVLLTKLVNFSIKKLSSSVLSRDQQRLKIEQIFVKYTILKNLKNSIISNKILTLWLNIY